MFHLSEKVKKVEDKINNFISKNKVKLPKYIGLSIIVLYLYGLVIRCIGVSIANFRSGAQEEWFTLNPFKNIGSIFSPYGIMITVFIIVIYCLFTKKGYQLISGYKTVRDKERGIEILPEGTHGTSGWMNKNELSDVLIKGDLDTLDETLFGKLENGEYVSLKDMRGMNKNIIIYGSPGTGKSRGFVMPFAMQAVKRGESLIMVDPKAEFYEMYSEFFREQGYTVCAYNLLDLFASDGWNCVTETANDLNLVQNVAEIIIRNTSSESDKDDFWAKAEKNLLMALLHYVGTMTYPGTDKLLPVEERSLGTIYKILSSTSVQELDAKFRSLPPDHPALPPYGIFRQAHKQIWGNIIIGLGNRLNVFQNKLVDDITKHHEIDLTLPGKQKCAYFCIISDQDSSLEFLSSMFFSLLFVMTLSQRDLSYGMLGDLREKYHPGETYTAILKEYDDDSKTIKVSVKEAEPHPFEGVEMRHPLNSRRASIISGKYKGGVFCKLEEGLDCLCTYSQYQCDEDFKVGDQVIVAVTKYDYAKKLVYGKIVAKW